MTKEARWSHPKVRLGGRVLRFLLGAALVWMVVPFFGVANARSVARVALIIVLLAVLYAIIHLVVSRYLLGLHPIAGAVLALVPAIFTAVYVPLGNVAVTTFIGASLILASVRADAGCEVLSIPGLLFRRKTHLACILFTPIDWVEQKLGADQRSES